MKGKVYKELKEALQIDVSNGQDENRFNSCTTQTHRERVLMSVSAIHAVQRSKKRIGFIEFVFRQVPFMGRDLWMTQGAAAFAALGALYLTIGDMGRLSIRHIPLLMGILAVMLVMASIPLMLMPYRCQMYEIEMISRISLPRLLVAKMILLAVEYTAVFALSAGLSTGVAGLPVMRAALYFALPLLAACTGCVQIIRHTDGWEEVSARVGMCEGYCVCLAAVLVVIYRMKPIIYDNIGLWILLITCMFPLCILSVRRWVMESGEVSERAGIAEI